MYCQNPAASEAGGIVDPQHHLSLESRGKSPLDGATMPTEYSPELQKSSDETQAGVFHLKNRKEVINSSSFTVKEKQRLSAHLEDSQEHQLLEPRNTQGIRPNFIPA